MKINIANLTIFFNKYKYLLIPIIPLVFFITLIFYYSNLKTPNQQTSTNITANPTSVLNGSTIPTVPFSKPFTPTGFLETDIHEGAEGEGIEDRAGLLKKENLPDGTSKYTYISSETKRPNIIIGKNNRDIFFERAVSSPDYPVKISDYTNPYGQPERIIQAPTYYGSVARTYIYATIGVAFVANPQTTLVLEQHLFPPMSTEEYIQKYSKD